MLEKIVGAKVQNFFMSCQRFFILESYLTLNKESGRKPIHARVLRSY
jgi:hypothetical protein